MDRQATIGFILIAAVFVIWMMMTTDQSSRKEATKPEEKVDTMSMKHQTEAIDRTSRQKRTAFDDSMSTNAMGKWFSHRVQGERRVLIVETDQYIAEFNTKGGSISRWTLKGFSTWNNQPLQLIDWKLQSDLNLIFGTSDGKLIDTKELFFDFDHYPESGRIVLSDSDTYSFAAILPASDGKGSIAKRFTVRNGGYNVELDIELRNMGSIIANYEFQVAIHSLALTERNSVEEASFAEADALVGNDRIKLDASDFEQPYRENLQGPVHWISTHNKYFLNALIARDDFEGSGVYIEGRRDHLPHEGVREMYQASMKIRFNGVPFEKARFIVFIGPMEYDLLKSQHPGLEQVLSLGWAWVVRPFSEFLILPLFSFLHMFIPNYGIVIIIFTILIKILLHPLTKSSMQSMKRMQALQPMMTELREKYKDDQQRQNTEMMKLYKDYGINPAGGCLPLLLQMPILFALFTVFQSTIELRQQPFVAWITDLSSADVLFKLPFSLPLLGTGDISGLALAMAVTMFIQQKMTIKDPRQKAMVYMMPIVFWLMFNGFPSGLNLYYFLFNLLSISQQYIINRKAGDLKLVKVERKNKKSWAGRALASMEQRAKEQKKLRK